ncbi:MAG: LysM peptidoglycan-binding domain-containing protein, partial [Chloroflexi bacterium]|nr:LysM peptidoglycan-binding domain-containing protein [Chloroflexota bacterium]
MKTEFSRIPLLFLIAILLLVACNRNDDPPPDIIDPPPVAEIAEKSDSGAAPLNVPTEPVEEPELIEEEVVVNEEPEEVTMEPAGPTPGSTVQHTVQVGDWLVQIARCYGASYSAVRQANPQIANPHYIIPGRTVTVPNIGSVGEINGAPCVAEYTVAAGETWIGLAKRFGTTAVILRRVNPGRLWAGDKIIVPAHSAAVVVVDPPPPPPPPPEPEPSRIMFAAGETAVTIGANVVANGQTAYIFRANEGQQHKITLAPSQDDVTFTLVNASNPSQNLPT